MQPLRPGQPLYKGQRLPPPLINHTTIQLVHFEPPISGYPTNFKQWTLSVMTDNHIKLSPLAGIGITTNYSTLANSEVPSRTADSLV